MDSSGFNFSMPWWFWLVSGLIASGVGWIIIESLVWLFLHISIDIN